MSDEPKSAFRLELDELGRKLDRMRIRWTIGLLLVLFLGYSVALWLLFIVLERVPK